MFLTKITHPVRYRCETFLSNQISIFRTSQFANFSDKKKSPAGDKNESTEKRKPEKDAINKTSASDRLNRLLASMNTDDNVTLVKAVNVPKAGGQKQRRAEKKGTSGERKPKTIVEAAKDVADLMGDGTKQTEAELLSKLLNQVDSAGAGGAPTDGSGQNLSELIVGMKIDRTRKPKEDHQTRGEFVRKTIDSRRDQQQYQQRDGTIKFRSRDGNTSNRRQPRKLQPVPSTGSVNLFDSTLGIFKNSASLKDSPDILETWSNLNKRELKLAVIHPAGNYFEKMIMWTEEGKIWKFPINNEQGMDAEAQVDFTEHVFLEQHLDGWCPDKGPIRHFMELVCTGLSKNSFITANEKKAHILWYRDYFEQKKDVLKEVIAMQKSTPGDNAPKKMSK